MRGRGMATVIRPFSFREFLRHLREEPTNEPRKWRPAERSLVEKRFREFLIEGGFPEAQRLPAALRIELLQGYVDTVLFRDVVERYGVSQVAALRWLVRQCLRNPAGSFSAHRLHLDLKAQGHSVGRTRSTRCSATFRTHSSSAPCRWPPTRAPAQLESAQGLSVDPGLVQAFDASGRSNVGHALETAVLNALESRGAEVGYVDRRRPGGGLPRAPPGGRGGAHPGVRGLVVSRDANARAAGPDRGNGGAPARDPPPTCSTACRAPSPRAGRGLR
jgi:predicted AAA+ superfamily ATPase